MSQSSPKPDQPSTDKDQDFGDWLKKRSQNRGPSEKPLTQIRSGITVDLLLLLIAAPFFLVALGGMLFFERYTMPRDLLQIGSGLLCAALSAFGAILTLFAAVKNVPLHTKLTIPLFVVLGIGSFFIADREMRQQSLDRDAEAQGKSEAGKP